MELKNTFYFTSEGAEDQAVSAFQVQARSMSKQAVTRMVSTQSHQQRSGLSLSKSLSIRS